jgi:hypothetical protein
MIRVMRMIRARVSSPQRPAFGIIPLALGVLLSACGGEPNQGPAAHPDGGEGSPIGTSGGPPVPVGLAVVSSDFTSTSVSLLDLAGGTLVKDNCIHSGTKAPALSVALSGDIALPSQPQAKNELVVIDSKNSALTWLMPQSCEVLRQMGVGGGFAAFPHDVVSLAADKAYVTRNSTNPAKPDEGSDILIIDPAATTVLGRIDLRPHATTVESSGASVLPFPSRALLVGGKVYVVLNNLSADFKAAGPGRVVIIDPASDQVTGSIDLPTLKNCGALDHPAANALVVGCGGSYAEGPAQIESSGVAWVDLSTSPPQVVTTVSAMAFGRPVSGFRVAAVSDALAFTLTEGDFMGPAKDALWLFDFKGSTPRKLLEAGGSFVLGLFLDSREPRLFLLEATAQDPKVQIFGVSAAGATKTGELKSNPAAGLPPRHMAWY